MGEVVIGREEEEEVRKESVDAVTPLEAKQLHKRTRSRVSKLSENRILDSDDVCNVLVSVAVGWLAYYNAHKAAKEKDSNGTFVSRRLR